jgi:hypothetical protein
MVKETIYFREKRFKNDVNGNPRRALIYYKKDKNNNLYMKDTSAHQYWSSATKEAEKRYPKANIKEIYEYNDVDTYREAERLSKLNKEK